MLAVVQSPPVERGAQDRQGLHPGVELNSVPFSVLLLVGQLAREKKVVGGRVACKKVCPLLTPERGKVDWFGNRVFADVIELRISSRDCPESSRCAARVQLAYERQTRRQTQRRGPGTREAETGVRRPQPRTTWGHWELEEAGGVFS